MQKGQFKDQEINLDILLQLLKHPEANYGFFAASRIPHIAAAIGKDNTNKLLLPKLKTLISSKNNNKIDLTNQLDQQIVRQIQLSIKMLETDYKEKNQYN